MPGLLGAALAGAAAWCVADVLLEVCVDSAAGLDAAVAGGADRIELCSALDGGRADALGRVDAAGGGVRGAGAGDDPAPGGGFRLFGGAEVAVMEADIAAARAAGLAGVVLGASLPDGRLDEWVLAAAGRSGGRDWS